MKKLLIIDNNAFHWKIEFQFWTGKLTKNNRELKYIVHYLLKLVETDDVRPFNRKFSKLEELSNLYITYIIIFFTLINIFVLNFFYI